MSKASSCGRYHRLMFAIIVSPNRIYILDDDATIFRSTILYLHAILRAWLTRLIHEIILLVEERHRAFRHSIKVQTAKIKIVSRRIITPHTLLAYP